MNRRGFLRSIGGLGAAALFQLPVPARGFIAGRVLGRRSGCAIIRHGRIEIYDSTGALRVAIGRL